MPRRYFDGGHGLTASFVRRCDGDDSGHAFEGAIARRVPNPELIIPLGCTHASADETDEEELAPTSNLIEIIGEIDFR